MTLSEISRPGGGQRFAELRGEKLLLSWLHVSDIHFGHGCAGQQWDQKIVAGDLQRDVARLVEGAAPSPSHIFVTGDVAFSGGQRSPVTGSSEYGLAVDWLDEVARGLGLNRDAVFLVPGNHDVDRSVDAAERETARLIRGARMGVESLDELFEHSGEVERLRRRQASFLEFSREFGPAGGETFQHGLWWRHDVELDEGISLRLCGLNTALLSADDEDQGLLRVGSRQLADLLVPAPGELELAFVLSHHPLTGRWLADEAAVRRRLDREAALHLFGHLHESDSEQARHGWGTGCLRIAAGAAHAEREVSSEPASGHGYNVGALLLLRGGELVVRIWPRRWSAKSARFVADVGNIDEKKGYAEHYLRQRVRREPPPVLQEGVTLCEQYLLLGKLGQGGVGQVWMARDKAASDTVVAVKILNPDGRPSPTGRRASFFRGPLEMSRVEHRSIVQIRDPHPDPENRHGPYDFYVMEYVAGKNLREAFTGRPCTDERIVEMMIAIAQGLAAAHARGVIHRDLKPSNILLGQYDQLTIVDFDTARDLGDPTRTRTGGHLVSDLYASPEVLDRGVADRRADVYSLAVTAMFLCRGDDPPKSYINRMDQLALTVSKSRELCALLAKASAHDVDRRFADMDCLLEALGGLSSRLGCQSDTGMRSAKLSRLAAKLQKRSLPPIARKEQVGPGALRVSPTPRTAPSKVQNLITQASKGALPGNSMEAGLTPAESPDERLQAPLGANVSSRGAGPWQGEAQSLQGPNLQAVTTEEVGADDELVDFDTFRFRPSARWVLLGLVGLCASLVVLCSLSGEELGRDGEFEEHNAQPDLTPWEALERSPVRTVTLPGVNPGDSNRPLVLVGTGRGGGRKKATVDLGKPIVAGPLDGDIVRRIIRAHFAELRACYEQALLREPKLAGKLSVGFSIDIGGRVPDAEVIVDSLSPEYTGLSKCVVSKVLSWKFPKPHDDTSVRVVAPLEFGTDVQSD